MEKVTLGTIAEICGVSRQAVSYALNNSGRLSEEKREEINRVAKELNYLPNAVARQMRKSSFDAIGLIFREGQIFLPPALLSGINKAVSDLQYDLKVSQLNAHGSTHAEVPKALKELSVDGFLIDFIPMNEGELIDVINNHSVPSVWVNNKREYNCVYPDDFNGSRTVVEQAINDGRKHPIYLDLPWAKIAHYSVTDRMNGYLAAVEKHGLQPVTMRLPGDFDLVNVPKYGKHIEAIQSLLKKSPKTDSIFCYCERTAILASMACMMAGKEPGKDVDIYGFSTSTIMTTTLPIYTVEIPFKELGEESVHQLTKRISSRQQMASIAIPYSANCVIPPVR